MTEFEPTKKNFNDNNWQRAQEIVAIMPSGSMQQPSFNQGHYHGRRRYIRRDFTPAEKAAILSRVSLVGVERAAREAGTLSKIVMGWFKDMEAPSQNRAVSQTSTQAQIISLPEKADTKALSEEQTYVDNKPVQDQYKEQQEIKPDIVNNAEETIPQKDTEIEKVNIAADFSTEEKAAIVAKAKVVDPEKVAEEFKTTLGVVKYLLAMDERRQAISAKATKVRKTRIKKTYTQKIKETVKKKAAHKYDKIGKNTIIQDKSSLPIYQENFNNIVGVEFDSAVEVENAMLKEKLGILTKQLEKLRSALSTLK